MRSEHLDWSSLVDWTSLCGPGDSGSRRIEPEKLLDRSSLKDWTGLIP